MSSITCSICLTSMDPKNDEIHTTTCGHVFHSACLSRALNTSPTCPQCRKGQIKHFQLFFVTENEEPDEVAGACQLSNDASFLAKQISQISKKLDNMSVNMNVSKERDIPGTSRQASADHFAHLQRENQDLKEILEMEKILSTNTEKEIDQLKQDVRERNDLINVLQMQNDMLRDETRLYESTSRVPVENLLDI